MTVLVAAHVVVRVTVTGVAADQVVALVVATVAVVVQDVARVTVRAASAARVRLT